MSNNNLQFFWCSFKRILLSKLILNVCSDILNWVKIRRIGRMRAIWNCTSHPITCQALIHTPLGADAQACKQAECTWCSARVAQCKLRPSSLFDNSAELSWDQATGNYNSCYNSQSWSLVEWAWSHSQMVAITQSHSHMVMITQLHSCGHDRSNSCMITPLHQVVMITGRKIAII